MTDESEAPLAGAETFDERRWAKWAKGRAERGLNPSDPFEGDPAEEARAELVDLANYLDQLHAQRRIGDEERYRAHATLIEWDGWLSRA